MARPKLDQPNYRLIRRGSRFYVRWWQDGDWQRVSTGTTDQREAQVFLAQFIAGQGTPEPPARPTVSQVLDGYLADRKPAVRHYERLEMAAKPLRRHLGDLEPDHLTKERIRFYRRRRQAEGHHVGPADQRHKKGISDGTLIRELGTLRAALQWAKHEKWISGDPPHIEMPEQPPPRDRWLTREEADRLLESTKAFHVRVFLWLCLYTAGRSGAIRELTWDQGGFRRWADRFGIRLGRQEPRSCADIGQAPPDPHRGPTSCHEPACDRVCRRTGRQPENWHQGCSKAGRPGGCNPTRAAPYRRDVDGHERCADGADRSAARPSRRTHHMANLRQILAGIPARRHQCVVGLEQNGASWHRKPYR